MDAKTHWEAVYQTKAADSVSWYAPRLETSLALIQTLVLDKSAALIDVGGGAATLVDDWLASGFENLSVLDISQSALDVAKTRLGASANKVNWICADIVEAQLPEAYFDLWHDRAVFHFLTQATQRASYVNQLLKSVKKGAYVLIATFGPEGPLKCSGLEVVRYDAAALSQLLGEHFELIKSVTEIHQTPFNTSQQFLYSLFKVV